MRKDLSIVAVDTRHYRVIAQENWGLSNEQMKGMHVHHRVPRSQGGTNDPSNLYVCSPFFHKHVWHSGEEWISYAEIGGRIGAEVKAYLWKHDKEWSSMMSDVQRKKAKKAHSTHDEAYSKRQSKIALKSVCSKRKWDKTTYDQVAFHYFRGITTGYLIAKELGIIKWRPIQNMMECVSLGLSFEQATTTDLYISEINRLQSPLISSLLNAYQ